MCISLAQTISKNSLSHALFFQNKITKNLYFSGFVEMDKTVSYLEHKSKYAKKWRGQKFKEAVALCDEFIQTYVIFLGLSNDLFD